LTTVAARPNAEPLLSQTMDLATPSLIKITLSRQHEERQPITNVVERLTERNPAQRFESIQSRVSAMDEEEIDP
jgi:topoisomerase-4 subunit B